MGENLTMVKEVNDVIHQINYPYKYPEVYAEMSRQGKTKTDLAKAIGLTLAGLRHKQDKETTADFGGDEMRKISNLLERPVEYLFGFDG